MSFQLRDGIVDGPCSHGHIRQRWILGGSGRHTGPIRDKDIFAGVELMPFIHQGAPRIFTHPHPAHFMNIEARGLPRVAGVDIGETGGSIHLRHLRKKIPEHFFVVVVVADIDLQLRYPPDIPEEGVQANLVAFFRDRFPHHMRTDPPWSGPARGKMLLQGQAYPVRRMINRPERRETGGIAAQKIGILILPEKITEAGNVRSGRATAVRRTIRESMVFRGNMSAVVMERDEFAEQPIVIAKPVRKPGGDRIQQDEVGIQRAGIDKNDRCIVVENLPGMRVDDANAGRLSFFIVEQNGMHDGKGAEGEIPRPFSPREGGGIAVEISAEGAATLAQISFLTLASPLLKVYRRRLGEMGAAPVDDWTVFVFLPDNVGKIGFNTSHFQRWQKFPIRQLRQSVLVA